MRVIAGTARGRRLRTLPGVDVRPTADRVKEALFSIILSRYALNGSEVLDLFAGSGALGIEALSRGAGAVTFVEEARNALATLRTNVEQCRFEKSAQILPQRVEAALRRLANERRQFDGVVLDPPYCRDHIARTLAALVELDLVKEGGWVMVEHHVDETPAAALGTLRLTQSRRYGKTALALFTNEGMPQPKTSPSQALRAVYAGSFDPITNGHLDLIRRGMQVFDQVIVAVAGLTSDSKKDRALFSGTERVAMIREALADAGECVVVDNFGGLLVDYCDRVGATVIIRGLRAVSDFEYEFQMAMMNRHLKPHIHTMFMATGETHSYTSSRLVKEVAALGGDVRGLVPEGVHRELIKKLRPSK
ncbi:MAG TPA: pantetheine-phosphate adenylyltransferase [Candidatus Acidoferrales bacterium]|nr:pantetheine-phosphate adenylyltransferase [Candidatus Acidoferrales bacterium]